MKQTNRKADLPLLLLAVVLIFLIVCPVGMIFAKAVMQNGRLDFSPAVQTLLNPENAHMIGNSLLLGVLVVLLSTLIAAPLAYLFSRTKFARYRVFDILFMIPFMTPPYIASMGWILFMLQNYITTRKSYNLVSGKGARRVEQSMGKGATVAAWAYIVLVLLIAVGVPYFSVISTSLINLRGYGLAPGNFTIAHYVELFTENEKGLSALKNSVFLAVTSATICAVLGTLLVLAVRKSHSKLRKVVEAIGLLPEMLPGIVLVIGIMLFWNQIYNILPLYNTMGIMVLAYVVLFLPYTVQYVTSSFTQISDSLMAAGQVFGGSPVYILRRITLPLIRQGIATGWMMTFIIAFRELVTASLIAPPNTLVVATFIVREFEQGSVSVGMAMAVLCVLFSTTALLILNTVIDHRKVH